MKSEDQGKSKFSSTFILLLTCVALIAFLFKKNLELGYMVHSKPDFQETSVSNCESWKIEINEQGNPNGIRYPVVNCSKQGERTEPAHSFEESSILHTVQSLLEKGELGETINIMNELSDEDIQTKVVSTIVYYIAEVPPRIEPLHSEEENRLPPWSENQHPNLGITVFEFDALLKELEKLEKELEKLNDLRIKIVLSHENPSSTSSPAIAEKSDDHRTSKEKSVIEGIQKKVVKRKQEEIERISKAVAAKQKEIKNVLPAVKNQNSLAKRAELLYVLADVRERLGDKSGANKLKTLGLKAIRKYNVSSNIIATVWAWGNNSPVGIIVCGLILWWLQKVGEFFWERLRSKWQKKLDDKKKKKSDSEKMRKVLSESA